MSRIKICGLRRAQDIDAVNAALPDYIGFVFAPSPRKVSPEQAQAFRERLDPRITPVGVFVNEAVETIAELYKRGIITMVQLHGDEDGDYILRIKELCGAPVIKAVGVSAVRPDISRFSDADYLLFDKLSPQRGGTGQPFAWQALSDYAGPPYFLAGGISASNAAAAIRLLAPFCLDVSSGVETFGSKDALKIAQVVREVRAVGF